MSVNIQFWGKLAGLIYGEEVRGGSLEIPVSVAVTGNVHRRTAVLANATNSIVYNDELSGFSGAFISSDYNTRVLISDNAANTFSFTLRGTGEGGKMGVPLMLGDDQTSDANTRINTIQIFNTSGNTANTVCLVIG